MALQKIQLRPGINRESTSYANEGGYYDCDKVRFRSGFPEILGGWVRLSNATFKGVCRALLNWITLSNDNYTGVGTNLKYYIEWGGAYYDITPIRETTTPGETTFSATNGSAVITVTHVNHGAVDGDFVTFSLTTGLGGVITSSVLNSEFQITYLTIDTYTIDVGVVADTSDIGDGGTNTVARYQINTGAELAVVGTGWGTGVWGRGGWGSAFAGGVTTALRLWTHDTYGEDLVFAPRGGQLYYWDASSGLAVRGVYLKDAATAAGWDGDFVPTQTNQVISSGLSRIIIALGANNYDPTNPNTPFDPLLVRWADQENTFEWVPTALTQAGEQRLTAGSFIVCGRLTRQEILIWTNSALYSMQYIGPPFVFGFNLLMDNLSIISPNATITVNNVTYWMGAEKFYTYSGRVETLPCSVRQYVFTDINQEQASQIVAGSNEGFSEVWWFYPSKNSNVNDRYVIYNHLEKSWYIGTMSRTAWLDSPLRNFPMAANLDNRIVYHEASVDDEAGDTPVPINAFIQSSDFDIGDGDQFGFVWRIIPDITFDGSTAPSTVPPQVTMTLMPRVNSGSNYTPSTSPTVTRTTTVPIEQYTGQVYVRVRGRQMALKVESNRLGTRWQLGATRIDARTDGRKD